MTNEVLSKTIRDAASRVREMRKESDESDGGYPNTTEGRMESSIDHAILAKAYLAENPEDSEELATSDWFKGEFSGSAVMLDDEYEWSVSTYKDQFQIEMEYNPDAKGVGDYYSTICHHAFTLKNPTRRQVRQLIAALTDPPTE